MSQRSAFIPLCFMTIACLYSATQAGFDLTIDQNPMQNLNHRISTAVTEPNGTRHVFTLSDALYHWTENRGQWQHERILDSPEVTSAKQLIGIVSKNRVYVLLVSSSNSTPPLCMLYLETGTWTVERPEWANWILDDMECSAMSSGGFACVFREYIEADRDILYFVRYTESGWETPPLPLAITQSRAYIVNRGTSSHCLFTVADALHHLIIEGDSVQDRIISQPYDDLAMDWTVDLSGRIHALLWGNQFQYATWSEGFDWVFVDIDVCCEPTDAMVPKNMHDGVRFIASSGSETYQIFKENGMWDREYICRAGKISDASIDPDGTIRFFLQNRANAFWIGSNGNWTNELVSAKLETMDYKLGFTDPDNPFVAALTFESLAIIDQANLNQSVTFVSIPSESGFDDGRIAIESPDRIHAITWKSSGASDFHYHVLDHGVLHSELVTNVQIPNPELVLRDGSEPMCIWESSDNLMEMHGYNGTWSSGLVHVLPGQSGEFAVLESPDGSVHIAAFCYLDSVTRCIEYVELPPKYGITTFRITLDSSIKFPFQSKIGCDRLNQLMLIISGGDQDLDPTTVMYRPGATGWTKSVNKMDDYLRGDSLICVDRFDHPASIWIDDTDDLIRMAWNSGAGWSMAEHVFPGSKSNEDPIVVSKSDTYGIVAASCSASTGVCFIRAERHFPWFDIFLRQPIVSPGSLLDLEYQIRNGTAAADYSIVVLLEVSVGGVSAFYNVPDLSHVDEGLNPIPIALASDEFRESSIFTLIWPDTGEQSMNLSFWGALFDPGLFELKSDIVRTEWGFRSM